MPAGTNINTINVLSVSHSSLEILGTVSDIVVRMEDPIRIYGVGLKNTTISNGLENGEVKVIFSKTGLDQIVISQEDSILIDETGNVVEKDIIAPVVEQAELIIDNGALLVKFSISETIDLSNGADVKLRYFTKIDDELIAMTNSIKGDSPLIKDKTWAGYLANVNAPAGNYSSGEDKEDYPDTIEADTLIGSKVKNGYRNDGSMDYVEVTDFNNAPGEYVVEITVVDNAGNESETVRVTVTVEE